MLTSGLNIKSLQISVQLPSSHNDEEVAACMAAIYAILGEDSAVEMKGSRHSLAPSTWALVTRLGMAGKDTVKEIGGGTATRRASSNGDAGGARGSAWRLSGLPVLLALFLSATITLAASASAQSSVDDMPTIAMNNTQATSQTADEGQTFDRPSSKTYIKVGLAYNAAKIQLNTADGATVRDAGDGDVVAQLNARSDWQVGFDGGRNICLKGKTPTDLATVSDGSKPKPVAYFPTAPRLFYNQLKLDDNQTGAGQSINGYLIVPPAGADNVIGVNGKFYRGAVWIKPSPADGKSAPTLTAINVVDLEDYLLSVLPAEMPAVWPIEALKAQAVAARSYAVSNIGKHGKDGYDLKATTDDQVYAGISAENLKSNLAVAQTTGLVMKHKGQPVTAFFHSTSGGSTELAENVFGKPLPYLKSVPDYDDSSPHFSWSREIKVDDLERALDPTLGHIKSMQVASRSDSGRVKDLVVTGTSNTQTVSGETMRKLFKLPSTNFNVGYKQNSYELAGRGFGHGLGMSQWGAKSLADQGYNAAQILAYYYKEITVDYAGQLPGI